MSRTLLASLLAGAAVAALAVAPSFAADLGPAAPPQTYVAPPAAVYDWTGFYVGINGGYGWGDFPNNSGVAPGGPPPISLNGADGGLIGGTLGYNWQFGHFVAGLETDIDWADISVTNTPVGARGTLDYLGTVRGRLGYAFDRVLLYGTGGFAYGAGTAKSFTGVIGSDSESTTGWTLGAGIEYAIWRNLTAKVEYRYTDLGNTTFTIPGMPAFRASYRGSSVIAGINYKFW
jgi:outer membrane immunogenic protein